MTIPVLAWLLFSPANSTLVPLDRSWIFTTIVERPGEYVPTRTRSCEGGNSNVPGSRFFLLKNHSSTFAWTMISEDTQDPRSRSDDTSPALHLGPSALQLRPTHRTRLPCLATPVIFTISCASKVKTTKCLESV